MAVFGGMTLTNKGLVLQGKAQAGAQLKYTRMAIGDGSLTGQSIPAMNGLLSQKISLPITRLRTQPPNKAIVGAVLRNADVATGFYWREVGLFAQDPDAGEILYAYANAGVTADYIPPGGGSDIIEKSFDCVVVVGTAANITAVIDESLVYALRSDLDAVAAAKVDKVSGKQLSTEDYTTAEKTKLAGVATGANNYTHPATHPASMITEDATHRFSTDAEKVTWNAKETTVGAQTKADNAQAAAALDATAKANAARDAAKAASIPIGQKGAPGGVVELDANRYISLAGINLSGAVPEIIYTESDTGKKWYQLVDGGVMSFREDDYSGERMQLNSDGMYVSGEVTSSGDMKMTGNTIEIGALIDVPFSTAWARGFTLRNGDISKQFQFGAFGTGVSGELEHAYIGYGSDPAANPIMQWKKDGTMKVFNSNVVKNLNADLLNGIHANEFTRVNAYTNFANGHGNAPITTAEFITILTNLGAFNQGHWVGRGSWDYAANAIITDTGVGNIHLAGAVVETFGYPSGYTIRITTPTTAGLENASVNSEFIYVNNGASYAPGWRKQWNSKNDNALYKPRQTIQGGSNLNDYVFNGAYSLYIESGAYLNGPPPGYYLLDVKGAESGYLTHTVTNIFGTVKYFRARTDGGVWTPWIEIPIKDATGKIANVSLNRYVALDKPLTTTSSTLLANYVPSKITMVTIKTSMRVAAVRSVSMAVVYTPPGETASRTIYILPENQMAPTDYSFIPLTLTIAANKPVEVHAKTTVADFVYVDAIITEEG